MAGFKVDIEEVDGVLRRGLARTYSVGGLFESEAAFKYELFHQLHGLKVGGHKLGARLPGARTCMLHAEASPINGLAGQLKKTDLLICDPTCENPFNYKTKAVIELKKSLAAADLNSEIKKFEGYKSQVPKLYIASANTPQIDREAARGIASKRQPRGTSIEVLDRYGFAAGRARRGNRRAGNEVQDHLAESVTECIKAALDLYGKNRKDPYHGFLWRNYEYETEKGWTFPCEGDFSAQLYHLLRSRLGQCVTPEYKPPAASSGRVDLFVKRGDDSVGIEIKMNYDNFKGRGDDEETVKISRKFEAMSNDCFNHSNLLVVIQGQDAHKGTNKEATLARLRQSGVKFGLMYYDERKNKAVGPVEV